MNTSAGLGYEDQLAVGWEPGPVGNEEALQRINADAARVLRALAALEDTARDTGEEASPLHQEIHRLEGKLDLVMSMVSDLAAAGLDLPKRRALTLRAAGLDWLEDPESPDLKESNQGLAALYLYPGLPLAVRLPAKVVAGTDGLPGLVFQGLTAETRNAMERHIFRHHRRAVARARRRQSAASS